jgi:UPF0716 protein FxsA
MFIKLFILFTVVPIIELYFLIKVGGMIGAFNTIIIIIITATIGALLAKTQGFVVFRRITEALKEGRMPGAELLDGLLVFIGGFALLTPGFITDLIGISMLIPFTRKIYSAAALKIIRGRIKSGKWNAKFF